MLRVTPAGVKTWALWYRDPEGAAHTLTLGRYPILSAAMAKDKAKRELLIRQMGIGSLVRQEEPEVETGPNDYLENLQAVIMISGEVRKDRWSVFTDLIYLEFADEKSSVKAVDFAGSIVNSSLNLATSSSLRGTEWTPGAGYAVQTGAATTLDVFGGLRYFGCRPAGQVGRIVNAERHRVVCVRAELLARGRRQRHVVVERQEREDHVGHERVGGPGEGLRASFVRREESPALHKGSTEGDEIRPMLLRRGGGWVRNRGRVPAGPGREGPRAAGPGAGGSDRRRVPRAAAACAGPD